MKHPTKIELGPDTEDAIIALKRAVGRLQEFIEYQAPAEFIDKEIRIIQYRATWVASAMEQDQKVRAGLAKIGIKV